MVRKISRPTRPPKFGKYGGDIKIKKDAEKDDLFPEGSYSIVAGKNWIGSYYPDTDEITLDIWDDNLEEIVLKAIQRKFPRSEATVAMMGRDFS